LSASAQSLGGHLKTGHTRTLQNRPTEPNQNKGIYTAQKAFWENIFSRIGTAPGGRFWALAIPARIKPATANAAGFIGLSPGLYGASKYAAYSKGRSSRLPSWGAMWRSPIPSVGWNLPAADADADLGRKAKHLLPD
jgi:hypothetical protein